MLWSITSNMLSMAFNMCILEQHPPKQLLSPESISNHLCIGESAIQFFWHDLDKHSWDRSINQRDLVSEPIDPRHTKPFSFTPWQQTDVVSDATKSATLYRQTTTERHHFLPMGFNQPVFGDVDDHVQKILTKISIMIVGIAS